MHGRDCGDPALKEGAQIADGASVIPPQAPLGPDGPRARALSDVFDELAAVALDPQAVLELTAARCAERVGEGCVLPLISDDGAELEPAASGPLEPERRAFIQELRAGRWQRLDEGVSGQVA